MGYPVTVALRYLASKKRKMVSTSTALAIGGVTLGVAALTIVVSVTSGFQEQFRDKVLGVNAHVLVLKYSIDFREYRDVMKELEHVPGVAGVAPFVINPMMVTHGDRTATGVLLKGVDPVAMPNVLVLPKNMTEGALDGQVVKPASGGFLDERTARKIVLGLRRPGAKPPERPSDLLRYDREPSPSPTTGRLDDLGADAGADAHEMSLMEAIADSVAKDELEVKARPAPPAGPAPREAHT